MSVTPMGAGSTSYYIGMVLDVEDYYLEPTEEPGRWHGEFAAELGLSGRVERADLETILEGRDPRTGAKIATWRKRPAYDLTLSATKSVSLLWGLGDADVTAVVEQSHDQAVDAAFAYMNAQACKVRRGAGGKWDLPAHGLLGAIFRHRTSRDLDPDLHSHVLVANVTRGADDEYSCPDGNLLFDHARAAGCIYQAVLRRQLCEQLGVRFGEVTKGYAEIVGIDRAMRRAFSKRRVAIEARMAEHGTKSRRGAEIAALATRKAKGDPLSEAQLRAAWEAEAAELGLEVSDSLGRPGPVTAEAVTDQALGHVLTEKHATFERRRIVEAVASSSRTGMTVAEIEARIDDFMASDTCVRLPTGRYSTPEMVALEREALHIATDSPPRRPATPEAVDAAVRARRSLSPEQRAAVRSITGAAAVSCVVGYAGAGKTFALDAAREAWHASGMDTVGCSLSARAARQLQTSSGIESDTADRLLGDLDTGRRRLTERSVVVIDETSMLGSRRLVRLMRHTARARAKMVLVGDPKQLPEIDAGGLFTVLARRLGCDELTENRRQRLPTERTTARAMRDGEVERALLLMGRTGRVTTDRNADKLRTQMAQDWHREHAAGADAVMLALHRSDVADLNRRARARRLAAGELGETVLEIGDDQFAVDDRVMTLRNNRRIGVLNGTLGTIVGSDGHDLVIDTDDGERRTLPLHYVVDGHVTHAYAFTIHKAQGLTVDVALLLGDDTLFAEAGYTGITRGRDQNRLYLVDPDEGDALKTAQRALERSAAKHTAIEQLGLGL